MHFLMHDLGSIFNAPVQESLSTERLSNLKNLLLFHHLTICITIQLIFEELLDRFMQPGFG